ncbi:MAG TPA: hypothetical protein VGV60_10905 [Candidatus Polarisedimenticolia bacterium]|jgi:hypothetical protein|nr:hypothetical protein [Candidatus Polarisedimenticolia bacterium]
MRFANAPILIVALASLAAACSASVSSGSGSGGFARVSLDGTSYEVRDVSMTLERGEDAWFRIEGEPATHPDEDCVPGLDGGLGLYGDLPSSVRGTADLAGKRLKIDFTGDGDDANFCFVGMGGLAGAEEAWVTIDSVDGDRVSFSMTGTFRIYDENGQGPLKAATSSGVAILRGES